ncbi:hypothetical protein AVEN_170609-1 [Araneus ventricosus]|uniref:Uncharacterized protein n=1 Tax=Araneus ventricosus TaxID=182803 RepID=A0A4Y2J3X0_ARAVE|nr:hypothetical protein AVEN_170609-1 [Araneus ventricosus]
MSRSKAIFLSRSDPKTTVNDDTDFLYPLELKFLQCHRLKTKSQTYAPFHIEVFENDLQQLLDSSISPDGCLIAEFFGKLKNGQISQEVIPGSKINHLPDLNSSTHTVSK